MSRMDAPISRTVLDELLRDHVEILLKALGSIITVDFGTVSDPDLERCANILACAKEGLADLYEAEHRMRDNHLGLDNTDRTDALGRVYDKLRDAAACLTRGDIEQGMDLIRAARVELAACP